MEQNIGFNAYIFYVRTKVYFNNEKYNILEFKINKNKYYDGWNKRVEKEGLWFQKIENLLPKKRIEFIRFFSYYYLKNSDFYIKDIIDEDMNLYKYNQYKLLHIKEIVKSDFRYLMIFKNKNLKSLKEILYNNHKLPVIFKMFDKNKISIYSLIIFNDIFKLLKDVDYNKLNFLDKERYMFYDKIIFLKFKHIMYDILYHKNFNWIDILKAI